MATGTKVSTPAGVADLLDRATTDLARLAFATIDIKMGDEAAPGAIAPAVIARGSAFLLD